MLRLTAIEAAYGNSQALFDVSITIGEGEVVTLLGRNGMGKTTTVRAIMGLLPARSGQIEFMGESLTGLAPEKVARRGIGLVPEGRQVFPNLTVYENLVATAGNRLAMARPWTLDRVHELFPRLATRRKQMANTLSGGEAQMLAIGRALMTNPRLLILDEATEGLAPVIRAEIWSVIAHLQSEGQSILVIDKNLNILKKLANRHYIIEKGRSVWSGDSRDLERDKERVMASIGV